MPADGPPNPSSSIAIASSTDRRTFLTSVGTLATTLTAGCAAFDDDDPSSQSSEPTQSSEQTSTQTPEQMSTQTPEQTSTQTPEPTPTQEERLANSFEAYTTPLETVDPNAPFGDLDFLRSTLADATVIGLGEATHGTREFFQFKSRLVRYLVEELGLRDFAWEADFGTTLAIDRYIRTGEDDAESAIKYVGFWIWEVESVLSMVEWMREFNEGRDPGDRIRFYGVDMQSPAGEITELQSFFDEVDDDFLDSRDDIVESFRRDHLRNNESALETIRGFVPALQDHLETNEEEFVAATSRRKYDLARRHAQVLEQSFEYMTAFHQEGRAASIVARNHAMAENARWVLEQEDADQLALWMHNGHINQNQSQDTGGILADWYGEDYYTVGMEFDHGSFQAMEIDGESLPTRDDIREFTVESAPADSLPGVLSKLEMPYAFVDLDAADDDDRLGTWLATKPQRTHIGAGFDPTVDDLRFVRNDVTGDFDGLLFVEETERARRL